MARRPIFYYGLLLAVILALWLAAPLTGVSRVLIPSLGETMVSLVDLLGHAATYRHLAVTAGEFLGAVAGIAVLGLAAGVAVGSNPTARRVLEPPIAALSAVPVVVFYPMCLLYFGIGPGSKVVFGIAFGIFPVILNTIKGVQAVEREHLDAARSMGASTWHMIRRVRIPAAMPMIAAGLRVGAILSLVAVIAGEMIASAVGLGSRITWAAETFEPGYLYAYILLVMAVIALAHGAAGRFERRSQR